VVRPRKVDSRAGDLRHSLGEGQRHGSVNELNAAEAAQKSPKVSSGREIREAKKQAFDQEFFGGDEGI
jgi:hypothetical protein